MAPVRSVRRVMQNDLLLLRLLMAVLKGQWRYTHIITFTNAHNWNFVLLFFQCHERAVESCLIVFIFYFWWFYFFLSPLSRDDKQIIDIQCMGSGSFCEIYLLLIVIVNNGKKGNRKKITNGFFKRMFSNLYLVYVATYVVFVTQYQYCRKIYN